MNKCSKCSAELVKTEVDERSSTPAIYGGKKVSKVVGTRFTFSCGAVVFQNGQYPDGTFEEACVPKQ